MENDNLKSELTDIRNRLYDRIGTGEIDAWTLLSTIRNHLNELDEFIDEKLQTRKTAER